MRVAVWVLKATFWMAIAGIPVAIDRVITDFMVTGCMPGSECLKWAMPLIVNVGLVNWVAYALLWPLSAWFLGGSWIVARVRKRWAYEPIPGARAKLN